MHKGIFILLAFFCMATLCIAGCTETGDNTAAATVTATQTIPVQAATTAVSAAETTPCYWDSQKMACADHPVTAAVTTAAAAPATTVQVTATPVSDPILHRWVRQYPATSAGAASQGYEFMFYPEGTVVYKEGTIEEISSNLRIPSPVTTGSGSWTKISEDHYMVKVTPVNSTGSSLPPIVRQYVHVAAYGTVPEHMVSDFEQTYVDDVTRRGLLHSYSEEVFYVDRVKAD